MSHLVKGMAMAKTTLDVELDQDQQERLQALVRKRESTPEALLRQAVLDYLDREEAYERERAEDEARYQHYLRTGEAVDHDDVMAWLDSHASGTPMPPPYSDGRGRPG